MKGTRLEFKKHVTTGKDSFNNPTGVRISILVDDCLIAPITEPTNAREQQAMHQSIDQVRIHIPKLYTGDLSDSYVAWFGKIFHLDSDSVAFMNENTPTRWNRYFRAECVGRYDEGDEDIWGGFFVTEDTSLPFTQEGS